jgi:predicted O-linked N-acetylglucosamine transferase (SPINDLY family)/glycosyltransferase involved in cell wall biosynthesis
MKKNAQPSKNDATGPTLHASLPREIQRRIESGRMNAGAIVDCAEALREAGNLEGSAAAYQLWLRGSKDPHRHLAWFNLGVMLSALTRSQEALEAYQQALDVLPVFPEALLNAGLVLERLGEPRRALEKWRILADSPSSTEHRCAGLNQIGRLSEILEVYDEAESALALSLQLKPGQMDALQHWLRVRQKRCTWPIYGDLPGTSKSEMLLATSPMALLGESENPVHQLYAARALGLKMYPTQEPPMSAGRKYAHRRLRIGYLSSDFNIHAVGLLLAELFESHDLSRFETFGFCVSKDDNTEHRQRIIAALEHFECVGHLSDEQIARRILGHEIDMLIDLNGVSSHTRVGVLRFRPAPVQATWLGFIGTTALPWIDYVIADRIALPEKTADFFTEKPLYLSHSFLPFDSRQDAIPTSPRELHHLPEGKFIFASFNNVTKLNPRMFTTWMRILKRVPESVFWLVDDNPWATANLRDFAAQCGVASERLIFAPRCPYGIHLSRLPHADLVLDNHPYNAGSTGNDTLHMGVPMLTLAGESFVSRMGYSLLHDFGLTELVTFSHQEYEDRAVALASNGSELSDIRRRLLASSVRKTPEKCVAYTRDLERLFLEATGQPSPERVRSVVVHSLRNSRLPLSICNEFQMVALQGRRELQLFSNPLPSLDTEAVDPATLPNFPKVPARTLSQIPPWREGTPDVVFNVQTTPVPYDGQAGAVFHFLSSDAFSPDSAIADLPAPGSFTEHNQYVITPSAWSKHRLVQAGMHADRVFVVPFGVDAGVFSPLQPEGRAHVRRQMGLAPDDFVLTHVGSMSRASGGDLLLRAFAELRRENPRVRLLLRENSFTPGGAVQTAIDAVNVSHPGVISDEVIKGMVLLPDAVSLSHAHFFYGVSDLYVAPFRSESFHLSVLEAVACGLPVVVTEGGSADVWMTPGVCTAIKCDAEKQPGKKAGNSGHDLEPSYEMLLAQLRRAVKQPPARITPVDRQKFLENWSWEATAGKLVQVIDAVLTRR